MYPKTTSGRRRYADSTAPRESATDILEKYFKKIGGRQAIIDQSEQAAKGKKRGRPASSTPSTTGKRPKKNGAHPANSTPSATVKKWSPPAGSWEDDIEAIDACEDEGSGKLVVFLIWKGGHKTKHDTSVIYKKCPQKVSVPGLKQTATLAMADTAQMLQFYEQHVKIIRDENKALVDHVEP